MRRQAGRGSASEGRLRARILKALPYSLTQSQQQAVNDIINDAFFSTVDWDAMGRRQVKAPFKPTIGR
jgi:RecG-like helicase